MADSKAATPNKDEAKQKRNYGPKQKVDVKIPDVITMLNEGKTRKEVGEHYGLNFKQTVALFKHPKLIGKKAKKDYSSMINIIDEEGGEAVPLSKLTSGDNGNGATQPETAKETAGANTGWDE